MDISAFYLYKLVRDFTKNSFSSFFELFKVSVLEKKEYNVTSECNKSNLIESGEKMEKQTATWKKALFWFAYVVAGICFVLTIIAFGVGFFHHMHDTGGWRSVIQILETPITGFIKMTGGYIGKGILEVIILIIVSYVLPIFFCFATHYLKVKRREMA